MAVAEDQMAVFFYDYRQTDFKVLCSPHKNCEDDIHIPQQMPGRSFTILI
jgi:hypothetical protein